MGDIFRGQAVSGKELLWGAGLAEAVPDAEQRLFHGMVLDEGFADASIRPMLFLLLVALA